MSTPEDGRGEAARTKPNIPIICATVAGGLALLGGTLWAADGPARSGIWQAIAVNIGTALLIAALLVYLEPRFRTRYVEAATRSAEAAAEQIEARLESRVDELSESIESARALFENYLAEDDEAVAAMNDGADFYTIAAAMVAANRRQAIDPVLGVAVPASEGIPSIVLRFRYVSPKRFARTNGTSDKLQITPIVVDSTLQDGPRVTWDMDWPRKATSEEAGAGLMTELQKTVRDVPARVQWSEVLGRLQEALALALDSKKTTGKLVGHHLIERCPGEWALTSAGIEYIGRGVIVEAGKFPWDLMKVVSGFDPASDIERPDWADADEWAFVMGRAREVLPRFNTPFIAQPPQYASTIEPRRPAPRQVPPVLGE